VGRLETLAQGVHSDFEEAGTLHVEDEEGYAALWARLADAPARPAVDFDTHTVIAALLGRRPSGGYAVEITGTDPVTTREHAPDGMAIQVLTSPYHVVRASR
jgi:PrcB C-terminal